MDLYHHSPSCILLIPPRFFLSLSVACHALQLKKKKIIRLHLTSPLLTFVHVLLWMIWVLKASVQVITFFLYNLFFSVWLFMWEYGFFIASNTTSSTLHFFYLDVVFVIPLWYLGGDRGGYHAYSVRSRGVQRSVYRTRWGPSCKEKA